MMSVSHRLSRPVLALSIFLFAAVSSVHAQHMGGSDLMQSYQFFSNQAQPDQEIPGLVEETPSNPTGKKSPFLAAVLSLAVPGLGEYYVGEQIWRGAIFTVLEAGLWYGNITYTNRGDDSTAAFQQFAHKNWDPALYSQHLNDLLVSRGEEPLVSDPSDFSQINAAEDKLNSLDATLPFSHRLPPRGHQQYYELISKYNQYGSGWIDATCPDLSCSSLSNQHSVMRDNMNRQYEIASSFLYGIFVNHVLSAIDAVLLANDYNSNLRLQGELRRETLPDGRLGYQTTARFTFRF